MTSALTNRETIRSRFRNVVEKDEFLVGAAIGSGLFAAAAEQGGADFLIALNAGRLRLMGAPSVACMLPIFDSNALVADFGANEFVGKYSIPIFFGASAMSDQPLDEIASEIAALGFNGVMNFPTVVHYPSATQAALATLGLSFDRELRLLAAAQAQDLWAVAHVRTIDQARQAAASGVDMICFIFGWTASGRRSAKTPVSLQEASMITREVAKAVKRENPESLLFLEGGPLENVEDLLPICRVAKIGGYIGGSTIDRLPLETAVTNQIVRFKSAAAATRKQAGLDRTLVSFGQSFGFVGTSPRMLQFYGDLRKAVQSSNSLPLVLNGPPGSSRQFTAETILRSDTAHDRFMTIDANEMSAQSVMIALFGHARYSNNKQSGRGVAGRADVTGLIVRNLEKLSIYAQRRLARFLASGTFRAVGSKRDEVGALRMLFTATTSVDDLAANGTLDPELYRELQSREIMVPALREYVEDIEDIITDMASRIQTPAAQSPPRLSPVALRRLQTHDWPGGIAELRAFVGRLVTLTGKERIEEAVVNRVLAMGNDRLPRLMSEREIILDALWRHSFHRGQTALFLGVSRKTLFNKIRHYRLTG